MNTETVKYSVKHVHGAFRNNPWTGRDGKVMDSWQCEAVLDVDGQDVNVSIESWRKPNVELKQGDLVELKDYGFRAKMMRGKLVTVNGQSPYNSVKQSRPSSGASSTVKAFAAAPAYSYAGRWACDLISVMYPPQAGKDRVPEEILTAYENAFDRVMKQIRKHTPAPSPVAGPQPVQNTAQVPAVRPAPASEHSDHTDVTDDQNDEQVAERPEGFPF